MTRDKKISNYSIRKPSFVGLAIGALIHSLGLKKLDEKIRQFKQINDYQLLKKIQKDNGYMDCSVGLYTKNGRKFFIKTLDVDEKDYRRYFLFNEWYISNFLYKTLISQKSQIQTPKPIEKIDSDHSVSLVYEFIDGKVLDQYSIQFQTKVFIQILSELNKISNLFTKDQIKFIPKRSIFFYLNSLPYLSFLTFFRTGINFKIITKAFLGTLKMLFLQKIDNQLSLAHRDFKPHNVIIADSKIFIVDTGRLVLTLPGYDFAFLSLDPAHTDLTKSLQENLNIHVNKFLKSYIALQFADSHAKIGMGKNYWKFLKTEYGNTNVKNLQFPKLNINTSKIFSKGIFAFRYLYHKLFSNFYRLGTRVSFGNGVTIDNAEHISLGDNVFLEKNVTLKFLEEFVEKRFEIPNLKIDDGVSVSTGTIIAAAKLIHIKKNAMIGPYCFVGDHDHEYKNINLPIRYQGYLNVKDIIIGEGAWIGANSTICSGVHVGKNSVIGANSVVTGDVPPFSLAVGSPAKVVKKFNAATKKWEARK